jgi:hypothetical protein
VLALYQTIPASWWPIITAAAPYIVVTVAGSVGAAAIHHRSEPLASPGQRRYSPAHRDIVRLPMNTAHQLTPGKRGMWHADPVLQRRSAAKVSIRKVDEIRRGLFRTGEERKP